MVEDEVGGKQEGLCMLCPADRDSYMQVCVQVCVCSLGFQYWLEQLSLISCIHTLIMNE